MAAASHAHPFAQLLAHHAFRGERPAVHAMPDALMHSHVQAYLSRVLREAHDALVHNHLPESRARLLDLLLTSTSVAAPTGLEAALDGGHGGWHGFSGDHYRAFAAAATRVDALAAKPVAEIDAALAEAAHGALDILNKEAAAKEAEAQASGSGEDVAALRAAHSTAVAVVVRGMVQALVVFRAGHAAALPVPMRNQCMAALEWRLALDPVLTSPEATSPAGMPAMAADLDAHFGSGTAFADAPAFSSVAEGVAGRAHTQACEAAGSFVDPATGRCAFEAAALDAGDFLAPGVARAACTRAGDMWLSPSVGCMPKDALGAEEECGVTGGFFENGVCRRVV